MIYFGCIYYVDPYLTPSRRKNKEEMRKKVGSVKKMFSNVSEMIHTKNQTGTPCLQTFAQILQIGPRLYCSFISKGPKSS